jgi:hypothetical protein
MARRNRKQPRNGSAHNVVRVGPRIDLAPAVERSRLKLEELAEKIKSNVLRNDPKQLLGYLWSRLLLVAVKGDANDATRTTQIEILQMALEYLHAVLSCFTPEDEQAPTFSEKSGIELVALCEQMHKAAKYYALVSTPQRGDGEFGPETSRVEIFAKANWVTLRGHRYQVLEGGGRQ